MDLSRRLYLFSSPLVEKLFFPHVAETGVYQDSPRALDGYVKWIREMDTGERTQGTDKENGLGERRRGRDEGNDKRKRIWETDTRSGFG